MKLSVIGSGIGLGIFWVSLAIHERRKCAQDDKIRHTVDAHSDAWRILDDTGIRTRRSRLATVS
jgi:hypothetical protein